MIPVRRTVSEPVALSTGSTVTHTAARGALLDMLPRLSRPVERTHRVTWHVTDDGAIRVVVTVWGRREVVDQYGETVPTLRDAWRVAAVSGAVHPTKARDRLAFRAWCVLART